MIKNPIDLFGIHKELIVENGTDLQTAFSKWDKMQLTPWLECMEKSLITKDYQQCIYLVDLFHSNTKDDLLQYNQKLLQNLEQSKCEGDIILAYLKLLRQLQKSLQKVYLSKQLEKSIRKMEIYISSPLNYNNRVKHDYSCILI